MSTASKGKNEALLKALGNPVRRRILRRMRGGDEMSPRDLGAEFGEPVTNVAYHVRTLVDCGAVRLVGMKPARGAVKHFYKFALEDRWALDIIDSYPEDEAHEVSGQTEG